MGVDSPGPPGPASAAVSGLEDEMFSDVDSEMGESVQAEPYSEGGLDGDHDISAGTNTYLENLVAEAQSEFSKFTTTVDAGSNNAASDTQASILPESPAPSPAKAPAQASVPVVTITAGGDALLPSPPAFSSLPARLSEKESLAEPELEDETSAEAPGAPIPLYLRNLTSGAVEVAKDGWRTVVETAQPHINEVREVTREEGIMQGTKTVAVKTLNGTQTLAVNTWSVMSEVTPTPAPPCPLIACASGCFQHFSSFLPSLLPQFFSVCETNMCLFTWSSSSSLLMMMMWAVGRWNDAT